MSQLRSALQRVQTALLGLQSAELFQANTVSMLGSSLRPPSARTLPSAMRATLPFVRLTTAGHDTCVSVSLCGSGRSKNEDAYIAAPSLSLYAVADGIGGGPAGEVASSLAIQSVVAAVRSLKLRDGVKPAHQKMDPRLLLTQAVLEANIALFAASEKERGLAGMGCTLDVVLTGPGGAYVAHVGDSRVYRLRAGSLQLLTRDQTLANAFLMQDVTRTGQPRSTLHRTLRQAMGVTSPLEPEVFFVDLLPGDRLLLCTDGLYANVPHGQLEQLVQGSLPEVPPALMDAAAQHDGDDDLTIVLVEYN